MKKVVTIDATNIWLDGEVITVRLPSEDQFSDTPSVSFHDEAGDTEDETVTQP